MNCFVTEGGWRGRWGWGGKITFWLGNWIPLSDFDKIWHGSLTLKTNIGRIFDFSQNSRWRPSVKGPKSTKFDPTNYISAPYLDPVHPILDKIWHGHTS